MLLEYEIAELWLNDLKNKEVAEVIKRFIADLDPSFDLEALSSWLEIYEDNSINLPLDVFNLSNVEPFEELETESGEIIFFHSPETEYEISNVLERDLKQRFQQAGLDYIVFSNAFVREQWGEPVFLGSHLWIQSRQSYEEKEIERARKAEEEALAQEALLEAKKAKKAAKKERYRKRTLGKLVVSTVVYQTKFFKIKQLVYKLKVEWLVVFFQCKGWKPIAQELVLAGGQEGQRRWRFNSLSEAQAFVENFDK